MRPDCTRRRLAGVLAVAALAPACTVSPPANLRLACTTLPVAAAPAAGAGGQHSRWDLPPVRGRLAGVAARSPGSAVAVGFTGVLGGRLRALVALWDGSAWRTLSSRALPQASYLGAVALFPGGAWAVGEQGIAEPGRDFFPLIVRVTGTTVRQVPVPGTGDGTSLDEVAATSAADAWAAGSIGWSSGPLIEHWNGTAWTRARLPATVEHSAAAGSAGSVAGVAASSRTNAWAVIYAGRMPLIVRWNGRRWEDVAAPRIGRLYDLNGVAATSARNVWAVGAGVILHWNGRSWTCALSPDNLYAVTAPSADNAWAVGDSGTGAVALHWDGHRWTQVMTPRVGPGGFLRGVAVIPPSGRDVWAVGSTGDGTLMWHWDGTAWQ